MRDDKLFFGLEQLYGVFDLDARYKGKEHAFAIRAYPESEALSKEWISTTFADLSDASASVTGDYLEKACSSGCRSVLLVKADTAAPYWHDYVVKHSRYIHFIKGRVTGNNGRPAPALAVVEIGVNIKGSALVATFDMSKLDEPVFERVDYLARRAATERML